MSCPSAEENDSELSGQDSKPFGAYPSHESGVCSKGMLEGSGKYGTSKPLHECFLWSLSPCRACCASLRFGRYVEPWQRFRRLTIPSDMPALLSASVGHGPMGKFAFSSPNRFPGGNAGVGPDISCPPLLLFVWKPIYHRVPGPLFHRDMDLSL